MKAIWVFALGVVLGSAIHTLFPNEPKVMEFYSPCEAEHPETHHDSALTLVQWSSNLRTKEK